MIDSREIIEDLRKQINSGKTQQQIADATGIGRSYLCQILSGKRNPNGLSIEKLNQLFPHATLNLNGGAVIGEVSGTAIGNVNGNGNNNNFFKSDDRLQRIQQAVMESDLDSEAKVKVWNIINTTK